jgi:hypothetical protein
LKGDSEGGLEMNVSFNANNVEEVHNNNFSGSKKDTKAKKRKNNSKGRFSSTDKP